MQDLSRLAASSMWVTSQEGGNMVHDNSPAMTAPGSQPATPVPKAEEQTDPGVEMGGQRPVGTAQPRRPVAFTATPMNWKTVD